MEKNQILEKLNENLQDIETVENEISMVELAIYQKNIEKLKNKKLDEIREFFEKQSRFYNQKSEKYKKEIDNNVKKYEEQIEKLINAYDNLYLKVFETMQSAINNQKIAMANIVTLTEKLENEELDNEEKEKIRNTILACAEKKLNYAIIIDESKARIKWCIQNIQKDIDEVFVNNIYQLQLYKENIINKIRRIIFNTILGKSNYRKFLENYELEYLKDIKTKNNVKIFDIISTLRGFTKQMQKTKKQISLKYNQKIYAR